MIGFPWVFLVTGGEGLTHSSVGSSSGSALGPSDSVGLDCGRLETSAKHNIGSISTSGLLVKATVNSWSGPEGNSNGVSNTAGCTSGWAGLAVKDSSLSLAIWLCWEYRYGVLQSRLPRLDQASGVRFPPDHASGVECPRWPTSGLGGLAENSGSPGLNIASGSQSLSTCVAVLQNQDSRASICPHAQSLALPGVTLDLISHWSRFG